jgi:hypothetical protein
VGEAAAGLRRWLLVQPIEGAAVVGAGAIPVPHHPIGAAPFAVDVGVHRAEAQGLVEALDGQGIEAEIAQDDPAIDPNLYVLGIEEQGFAVVVEGLVVGPGHHHGVASVEVGSGEIWGEINRPIEVGDRLDRLAHLEIDAAPMVVVLGLSPVAHELPKKGQCRGVVALLGGGDRLVS